MNLRLCQLSLVAACALYMALVVFNNLTDYGSNFALVQHVLMMDSTFPGNSGLWRALHSNVIHHAFYVSIILWETACTVLLALGSVRLWSARHEPFAAWLAAKAHANTGLTLGLLLWFLAFITVGGEWFLMWQSSKWNGLGPALRLFTVMGFVLLLLNLPEGHAPNGSRARQRSG
jgi:predicted small integral membrane protein